MRARLMSPLEPVVSGGPGPGLATTGGVECPASDLASAGSGGSTLPSDAVSGAGALPCAQRRAWALRPSTKAKRTSNPLRNIVDNLKPPTHHPPSKPLLSLSLGDPTVFGNLPCPEVLTRAIVDNATAAKHNGYVPSAGLPSARKALARAYSYDMVKLSEEVRGLAMWCSRVGFRG